jgi:hypothetical protein
MVWFLKKLKDWVMSIFIGRGKTIEHAKPFSIDNVWVSDLSANEVYVIEDGTTIYPPADVGPYDVAFVLGEFTYYRTGYVNQSGGQVTFEFVKVRISTTLHITSSTNSLIDMQGLLPDTVFKTGENMLTATIYEGTPVRIYDNVNGYSCVLGQFDSSVITTIKNNGDPLYAIYITDGYHPDRFVNDAVGRLSAGGVINWIKTLGVEDMVNYWDEEYTIASPAYYPGSYSGGGVQLVVFNITVSGNFIDSKLPGNGVMVSKDGIVIGGEEVTSKRYLGSKINNTDYSFVYGGNEYQVINSVNTEGTTVLETSPEVRISVGGKDIVRGSSNFFSAIISSQGIDLNYETSSDGIEAGRVITVGDVVGMGDKISYNVGFSDYTEFIVTIENSRHGSVFDTYTVLISNDGVPHNFQYGVYSYARTYFANFYIRMDSDNTFNIGASGQTIQGSYYLGVSRVKILPIGKLGS